MKRISLLVLLIFSFLFSFSQNDTDSTKTWDIRGNIALNFSEASFSNWIAGGKTSISGVGLFDMNANYTKGKNKWENTLNFGYGLLKEGKKTLIKSEDRFELNSKYGYQINNEKLLFSSILNFKSQIANGFNYPDTENKISGLFSPAYLTVATGFDYKPSPIFSIFLSPLSGKFTFIADKNLSEVGSFGVDPGKKARAELGAFLKSEIRFVLVENVDIHSKIDLFSNYLNSPEKIDINWDLSINMKINDFLSANFISSLIYDYDILIPIDSDSNGTPEEFGRKVQFKQLLGIGISYKF